MRWAGWVHQARAACFPSRPACCPPAAGDLSVSLSRALQFAGTRYLKRGVTDAGYAANDVEVEQVVEAGLDWKSRQPLLSSVVQVWWRGRGGRGGRGASRHERPASACWSHPTPPRPTPPLAPPQVRGSIPLHWAQQPDSSMLKPEIVLQRFDPLYQATQRHFDQLRCAALCAAPRSAGQHGRRRLRACCRMATLRCSVPPSWPQPCGRTCLTPTRLPCTCLSACREQYGEPVCVLDLVKRMERRPRESILGQEFAAAVRHLNARLPPGQQRVQYAAFDLSHIARTAKKQLLGDLQRLQEPVLAATGIFTSGGGRGGAAHTRSQHGVLRTNCIDSLDRTNLAQFTFGMVALGQQLHALGISGAWARQGGCSRRLGRHRRSRSARMPASHPHPASLPPALVQRARGWTPPAAWRTT